MPEMLVYILAHLLTMKSGYYYPHFSDFSDEATGTERLSKLSKVTRPASGRAGMWTQISDSGAFPPTYPALNQREAVACNHSVESSRGRSVAKMVKDARNGPFLR